METKKLQLGLKITLIVCLFLLIYGAQILLKGDSDLELTSSTQNHSEKCDLSESSCALNTPFSNVIAKFDQRPEIEETITLRLTNVSPADIQSVHIEGVNMYMGKIPVVPLAEGNTDIGRKSNTEGRVWRGWTSLGACSEPDMIWEVVVTFRVGETDQQTSQQRMRFTTHAY